MISRRIPELLTLNNFTISYLVPATEEQQRQAIECGIVEPELFGQAELTAGAKIVRVGIYGVLEIANVKADGEVKSGIALYFCPRTQKKREAVARPPALVP
jgi:hypothetical protein